MPPHAIPQIVEQLAACNIRLVASLPDDWISGLIGTLSSDPRFTHVPVNREESAIGLCAGAYFGGVGAVALMGASGFMTCVYATTKINYTYQLPLLFLLTLRGSIGDPSHHHVGNNGLYFLPVLDAVKIPYTIVDAPEKIPLIAQAYEHARALSRPVAVAFTRPVLRGARAGEHG